MNAYEAGRATRSAASTAKKTTVVVVKSAKTAVADFFRGLKGEAMQPAAQQPTNEAR